MVLWLFCCRGDIAAAVAAVAAAGGTVVAAMLLVVRLLLLLVLTTLWRCAGLRRIALLTVTCVNLYAVLHVTYFRKLYN